MHAVALIGSWARRTAGPGSDVDLVVIVDEPEAWFRQTNWVERFGTPTSLAREDYGEVQSMRVHYADGLEVEFGLTTPSWVGLPLDEGTAEVLNDGVDALYDPTGELRRAVDAVHPPMPVLSSGQTRVRPWTSTDLACVEQASATAEIPRCTTVPVTYTPDAGREWIERQWSRHTNREGWSAAIADASTNQAIGCVALLRRPQAGVAGLGYWVVPAARGHGHASRAVRLVTDWALDPARFDRIEAWVEPGNDRSTAVLRACGFQWDDCVPSGHSSPREATHWCSHRSPLAEGPVLVLRN